MSGYVRNIPTHGAAREALRKKGQFWTPDWIADAMVEYVLQSGADRIFDPAVGAGAFFRAARSLSRERGEHVQLCGTEIDPAALAEARITGLNDEDLAEVRVADFVLDPPAGRFSAIVANPPYLRHHRLPETTKRELKALGLELTGHALDGRTGYHVFFLLRALQLLANEGRLAFILPADVCEGVFSLRLWEWITRHYCLDALITFAPKASPFPHVDTNPIICLIRNRESRGEFMWVRCLKAETGQLRAWIASGMGETTAVGLEVVRREISEGINAGLSREPKPTDRHGATLGDFATVLRGIATGANEYFFLSRKRAATTGLPDEFLKLAIGRTRDVQEDNVTTTTLAALDAKGRPTLLFCPDGRPLDGFPESVQDYLRQGEALGLDKRPLISTRNPWYKMETRRPPAILFAYLGRRNSRFIRNVAGVVPLTGFLCVYPKSNNPEFVGKLWSVLRHPSITLSLARVGKSYGDGAIKVEPRALERLPIPQEALVTAGLHAEGRDMQCSLRVDE